MSEPKNIKAPFSIDLKTITPVSIGNGEILSPYTDFVLDGEKDVVRVVDKQKIVEKIHNSDNQKLMTTYINGIYDAYNNNRSEFDLKGFIEDKNTLGLLPPNYTTREIAFSGLNRRKRQEIKCIVKDNQQPFVSGSTLKGAFKGAILYDWFKNTEAGKKELNYLMKEVLSVFKRCQDEIKAIDKIAGKRYVSRDDKNDIRSLKRKIADKGGKQLKDDIKKRINNILNSKYPYFYSDFHNLKITDSELIAAEKMMIQTTNRLHYVKGKVTIPVNLEAISAKTSSQLQLQLQPNFAHQNLDYLNGEQPIEALFKRINKFSFDNLSMEIDLLVQYPGSEEARGFDKVLFRKYKQFLGSLADKIEKALPNEAYLCVGFGKSFFYNSFGILINDWDLNKDLAENEKTVFQKYAKLLFLGRDGQRDFPYTRTITRNGEGMGWMKLVWRKKQK